VIATLGEILPLALAIAVSPLPIIAVILMLLSPKARLASSAFVAGWLAAVVIVSTLFSLAVQSIDPAGEATTKSIVSIVTVLLGLALILLAVRQWLLRPAADATPELPVWMNAISTMRPSRGFAIGLLLAGVNPKNLALGISAGLTIGRASLPVGEMVGVIAIYAALASATVTVPVIGYLVAAQRLTVPLGVLRDWLVRNNRTVMSVVLFILGVVLVGNGLAAL
jgi:hypothetical protein